MADGEITLTQSFQMLSGTIKAGGKLFDINAGRIRGNDITISGGGYTFTGKAEGNRIEGTVTINGKTDKWTASR